MLRVFFWVLVFNLASVISITLLGVRSYLDQGAGRGEFLRLLFNWRFVIAMGAAALARLSFIYINLSLYALPAFEKNATTIATALAATVFIPVVIANIYFLGERLSTTDTVGFILIMSGVYLLAGTKPV